jgi:pyrroloquinoline quinone biosynthesis protein E
MFRKAFKQFQLGVKNPGQAARVLASEARMRAGVRTLRSVELAVTWICNLDCKFCYAEDLMKAQKRPPDMPVETVGKLTRDARDLGMIHVNVTGGEPMVRKDIYDVVDAIPKDVVVSLVTNSTLLTKEKIDRLKSVGSPRSRCPTAGTTSRASSATSRATAWTRASASRCPS